MPKRAVVIGLDGAAWHLLNPLLDEGVMPNLARLRDRGARGRLSSTIPTYTPPAWTSAVTGVNPGRHGVYGFHAGHAQNEQQELMHSGRIRSAPLWEMANVQGARIGVFNLPLTYPPRPLDGWMVSGMMTPSYGHRLKGFVSPPDLEQAILHKIPDYLIEMKTSWDLDWRDDALCRRALDSIEQRRIVLELLLESEPLNLVFAVLEAPDRLQHAYYRYMDPSDAMFQTEPAGRVRPWIARCFEAMDEIAGLLVQYAGNDGGIIVCSDHGFTAWEFSVHTNALLERWGYLKLKPGARLIQTGAARRLIPLAKRILPAKAARAAKGRTFAAVDWSKTKAFASPIPQQGIFLNIHGRERHGIVPPEQRAALAAEIADRFATLKGPDGSVIADRVWRSEDVFSGHALDGAPDILPVLRDHRFELDDELFHREPFSDQSNLPRGVHHPDGIGVVAGAGVRAGAGLEGSILDVTPTLLYLAGLQVPEGLDGSVMRRAFDEAHLKNHPIATMPALNSDRAAEESPYTAEEEAEIEESLRGLGYI
jgi:predicted AlkP superfamily phosphohydrolase/phosphomutase